MDSRLDALDGAVAENRRQLAGTNVTLAMTIEQAKGALNAIADWVRIEMAGVHNQFRVDGDLRMAQLSSVADATQQKFSQIEMSFTRVASGLEARLAAAEVRATRGEQQVDQLLMSAPLGKPASTPPQRPRRAAGSAWFDPWQAAAARTRQG